MITRGKIDNLFIKLRIYEIDNPMIIVITKTQVHEICI